MNDTVGRYRLVKLLGQGATADVHLAYAPDAEGPDRSVALKCTRPELRDDSLVRDMFLYEARLITMFHHPNVVRAFEQGEDDHGSPFIALEYLNGEPLFQVLSQALEQKKLLSPVVVARIALAALAGLDHVHNAKSLDGAPLGVVHCDISPYNLFVTYDGRIVLIDFGVAQSNLQLDTAYEVRGRYAYMAPEQARNEAFDGRADVFSLGVVLWELVGRMRLFKRQTDDLTREALLHGNVPGLLTRSRSCPPALDAIVQKALARDPAERYASARAMRDELLEFLAEHGDDADAIARCMNELFAADPAPTDGDSEPPTLLRRNPMFENEAPSEGFQSVRVPRLSGAPSRRPSQESLAAVHLPAGGALPTITHQEFVPAMPKDVPRNASSRYTWLALAAFVALAGILALFWALR